MNISASEMRKLTDERYTIAETVNKEVVEKAIINEALSGGDYICTMRLSNSFVSELQAAGFNIEITKLDDTNKEVTKISW